MTPFSKYLPLIILPASIAVAQSETSTNSTPSSTIAQSETATNSIPATPQIAVERTQEERVEFLVSVAESYRTESDFISAIDVYERILVIDPAHTLARYMAGYAYISAKQYKKAESTFLALLEDYPEDFKIWNNLAWLYATAEDPAIRNGKKSIEYAHEAMTLAPKDYHVWSTLSESYYVSGEYEKALRAILHMASLAARYGTDITEEAVKEYNNQILKCKRAMDTANAMKPDDAP